MYYQGEMGKMYTRSCSTVTERNILTKEEVMNTTKATGPEELCIEFIKALEEFGVEHLTKALNKVYSKGHYPDYMSTSPHCCITQKARYMYKCVLSATYNKPY